MSRLTCCGCDATDMLVLVDDTLICPRCKAELEADAIHDAVLEEQRVAEGLSLWAHICQEAGLNPSEALALARAIEKRMN